MAFNGWMIPDEERERLLLHFPPRFPIVRASHVTLEVDPTEHFPVDAETFIVGYSHDDTLECYIVAVNDSIRRPDGKIFHITWSYEEGRASKDSNDVIAMGYTQCYPVPFATRAFYSDGEHYITSPLTSY